MRHRTIRTLASVAAAVALSAGSLSIPPGVAIAVESPSRMATQGRAGCIDIPPKLKASVCDGWDKMSTTGPIWIDTEDASVSSPWSMHSTAHVGFDEMDDGAGHLTQVHVQATLVASIAGGGRAASWMQFSSFIDTKAPTVHVAGSITLEAHGSELVGSYPDVSLSVNCGDGEFETRVEAGAGAGEPNADSETKPLNVDVNSSEGAGCSLSVDGKADSATNRDGQGQSGSSQVTIDVTFSAAGAGPTPSAGVCDGVQGDVRDGNFDADNHDNLMGGVRVQLWRNNQPVGAPVATAADGGYCLRPGESVQPGDYTVRATLLDQAHEPSMFETRYQTATEAPFVEKPVSAGDFGTNTDIHLEFSDPARDWLDDVADIHWQSTRFVDWLVRNAVVTPELFGHIVIVTFDTAHSYSYYSDTTSPPSVHIADASPMSGGPGKSTFAGRAHPFDNGPENAEWHEIGHHVATVLGIADIRGPACDDRVPHGGWVNSSTCDSLAEGFPIWLPTIASTDIDIAAEVPGYGDAYYAEFENLDYGGWWPWTLEDGAGREDFAVAQLLWDLADDDPTDPGDPQLRAVDASGHTIDIPADEKVGIGSAALVQVITQSKPQTVADLYVALQASALVPAALKVPEVDLDGDEVPDVSALEEEFLSQGFHPVHSSTDPRFRVGDAISHTDRALQSGVDISARQTTPEIPNAAVRLRNGTDTMQTITIDVAFAKGHVTRTAAVPAHSTTVEYLELPPYFRQVLATGDSLPACGEPGQTPAIVTIQAPGGAPMTLDSCAYWHDVAASTDGAAVTYSFGNGPFVGPAASGEQPAPGGGGPTSTAPIALLIGAGALLAVLVVGGVLWARRRGRSPIGS